MPRLLNHVAGHVHEVVYYPISCRDKACLPKSVVILLHFIALQSTRPGDCNSVIDLFNHAVNPEFSMMHRYLLTAQSNLLNSAACKVPSSKHDVCDTGKPLSNPRQMPTPPMRSYFKNRHYI